jgi:hypothetical protein
MTLFRRTTETTTNEGTTMTNTNRKNTTGKIVKLAAGLAMGTFFVAQASAGTLGATSTDTSIVTLEVVDLVQITNINDIALGAYSGTGTLSGATEYCVFRNGGDDYTVKLTTDTGSFKVNSPTTGDDIVFTAKIDADADASDGEAVVYNVASSAMAGSDQTNCGGADNGAIEVSFAQSDLLSASSGNDYRATMTVLVEPI